MSDYCKMTNKEAMGLFFSCVSLFSSTCFIQTDLRHFTCAHLAVASPLIIYLKHLIIKHFAQSPKTDQHSQYECLQLFSVKTSESRGVTPSLSLIYIKFKRHWLEQIGINTGFLGFRLMLEFSNIVEECVTQVWSVALLTRAISTTLRWWWRCSRLRGRTD